MRRNEMRRTLISRGVRDANNLRVLVGWSSRFFGSFTISKELREDKRGAAEVWRVIVLRNTGPARPGKHRKRAEVLFDGVHADISTIVMQAAQAVEELAEMVELKAAQAYLEKRDEGPEEELGEEGQEEAGGKDGEGEITKYDYDIWFEGKVGDRG